jgi:hypothetical protein
MKTKKLKTFIQYKNLYTIYFKATSNKHLKQSSNQIDNNQLNVIQNEPHRKKNYR